jgi:S-methyl-5-thioribose-1-phosphate isomerase
MTDRPDQPPAGPPGEDADLRRRRFFRQFAGDVLSSVGSVLGAAQALQRESADAARELLAVGEPLAAPAADAPPAQVDASTAGFRAPFRWDAPADVCWVVDQRRLPDVIAEIEVRGAADGVNAINDGAVIGSAVQAQVVAATLAIVASRARTSRPFARRATIRGAANAFRLSRPGSAAMGAALDRMLARLDLFSHDAAGDDVAAALREEAESIVFEATNDHGALVEHGVGALPGAPDEPLHVLVFGSTGAMGGGQCGTALAVVQAAHHAGRPVHALVAETRPRFEGSRIAAWELGQAGVPYAIVTDAAAAGCIAVGEVRTVLVTADRIAADGDVVAPAGTYPLALAARAADVPFLVFAATTVIDPRTPTGDDATIEEGRPGPVLRAAGTRIAPEGSPVRNPVQDLTPADLVTAIVTEAGVLRAPYREAIVTAIASANARRAASPGFAALVARAAEAIGTSTEGTAADGTAAGPAEAVAGPSEADVAPAPADQSVATEPRG